MPRWTMPMAISRGSYAGVAIGGAVWALVYEKSRSLLGPAVSHMLVDAGIFLIGYDVVLQQLASGG